MIFYNGEINESGLAKLIGICADQERYAQKALLILVTYGGTADSAYRCARFLQERYDELTVFVPWKCKSAGTIIAIGAHRLLMSDFGELGPLDVQVRQRDELMEYGSGASIVSALEVLREQSFEAFEQFMLNIKRRSKGAVTLRTCTDIAASMTVGLFKEIFSQVDPKYLGEMSRNLKIAHEYGTRLAAMGENIQVEKIHTLVYGYPDHGFVIDRREAKELFRSVDAPEPRVLHILAQLGERGCRTISRGHEIVLLANPDHAPEERGERRETPSRQEETTNERIDQGRDADRARIETTDRTANSGDAIR